MHFDSCKFGGKLGRGYRTSPFVKSLFWLPHESNSSVGKLNVHCPYFTPYISLLVLTIFFILIFFQQKKKYFFLVSSKKIYQSYHTPEVTPHIHLLLEIRLFCHYCRYQKNLNIFNIL